MIIVGVLNGINMLSVSKEGILIDIEGYGIDRYTHRSQVGVCFESSYILSSSS